MRVAVIGKTGQLAQALRERAMACGQYIVALGREAIDLAALDPHTACRALEAVAPQAIINAAAYTAVDRAESEADQAFAVNRDGVGALAHAAKSLGIPLVHVSTDYVFAGDKPAPYTEDDPTGPTGAYGMSKLAGERAIIASGADAAILRTAWVISPFGHNFVKTMLRLAATRDEVGVVADQRGCPTSALDLGDAALAVAANLVHSREPALRGVFHAAGVGDASWAELAEAVFAISTEHGGPSARVKRIATADYPTPAKRPANSRLDCARLARCHGVHMRDWHASLAALVARIVTAPAMAGAQP